MRIGGGLFGLVGDMIRRSEQDAAAERQRENMLVATMSYSRNTAGESPEMRKTGMQLAPGMDLADAVAESMRYAEEMSARVSSPEEGALRPVDQLRKDYLAFLGFLHNPEHADPVQQVGMVNSVLRMNLTPQAYFGLREKSSMDPEFVKRVPASLKYFVQDDLAGSAGPINSGFCMSRFLVNTFRDFGHTYIYFGGITDLELHRLTDYVRMLNHYLQENGLLRTMDPFRKGETGMPYFGLPVNPEDAGEIDMPGSGGIDMPGAKGIDMPGAKGIDMPGARGIDMPGAKGIDMPGAKGIDMPGTKGIDMPGAKGIDMPGTKGIDMPGTGVDFEQSRGDFCLGDRDSFSRGEKKDGTGERDALGFAEGEGLGLGNREDFYL